jgi:regulator of sirC expression with transglutaminase-like and TPR domain
MQRDRMKTAGTSAVTEELSDSQRTALLTLLADEDPSIFHTVRDRILAQGPTATDWLRPHTLSRDPALRRRTQDIVVHFDRMEADNRFLAFCLQQGQDCDLEQGAWLLAQTRFPDINVEGYKAMLDSYASDLLERVDLFGTPHQIISKLNDYLFGELGYVGNEENYYDPDNSFLNRVIDRRTGNPINLCLLFMLVARRLNLPVTGIGLPGHFICRYQTSSVEIYIDPFSRGKLMKKVDCINYLLQANYSVRDDYLAPVKPRRMLLRICKNLHQIYRHQQQEAEMTRFQRYEAVLSR